MGMFIIKNCDESDVDKLYKKTDELLYKAKENGKNNIKMSQ
ncbi:hypothetical protein [Sulfurimonas sp.]|nr:hypothetical protein [Sulfurimonas sp.]